MRLSLNTKYGLIWVILLGIMACEDPQSINNISVVNNPFIQRTDTLSQINSLTESVDSLAWSSIPRLFLGNLPGYHTGIMFKVVLDSALVDSVEFDSVYVRFDRDMLYQNDPSSLTYPSPADVVLFDARNVTLDAASGTWGDSLSTTTMYFGAQDTTLIIYLNRDSVLSVLKYDTLKTMTFTLTTWRNDFMQRFYSYEGTPSPKLYFRYTSLDSTIARYISYDQPVVSWNPGELDTADYHYISVLGAQKLEVNIKSDSLLIPEDQVLQHVLKAYATFNVDTLASKMYAQVENDAIGPRLSISVASATCASCNQNIDLLNKFNNSKTYDITSLMSEAVSVPNDSTSFTIRPNYGRDMNPGYLAVPKNQTGNPVMKIILNSARVVTP